MDKSQLAIDAAPRSAFQSMQHCCHCGLTTGKQYMVAGPAGGRRIKEAAAAFLQIGGLKIPFVSEFDIPPRGRPCFVCRRWRAIIQARGRCGRLYPQMSQRSTECFCESFQFDRELGDGKLPSHTGDQFLECVSVSVNAAAERFRKVKQFLCLIFHRLVPMEAWVRLRLHPVTKSLYRLTELLCEFVRIPFRDSFNQSVREQRHMQPRNPSF